MAFYSLKTMAFCLSTFSFSTFPLPFSRVLLANENDECNWHRKVVLYLMAEWFSGRLGTPVHCTDLQARYGCFLIYVVHRYTDERKNIWGWVVWKDLEQKLVVYFKNLSRNLSSGIGEVIQSCDTIMISRWFRSGMLVRIEQNTIECSVQCH